MRAAGDVGIRLALSCPLLDHDAWAYDGGPQRLKPFLSADDWQGRWSQRFRATLRFPPCSRAAEAVAAANSSQLVERSGPIDHSVLRMRFWRRLQRLPRTGTDASTCICLKVRASAYGWTAASRRASSPYPDNIGFLSPPLAIAHGVQLRPDELNCLRSAGCSLSLIPQPICAFARASLRSPPR